jgi:hypothetical protein
VIVGKQPTRIVDDVARRLMLEIRRDVRARLGPLATYEQRRDAAVALASDALWLDADEDLREVITSDEEVEVEGRRYRKLAPSSSATYHSRWGSHHVEEALYREVGVHNGPTIKPIELRVGIVEHMTPDMARIVGALSADRSSRGVERTLHTTGLVPPSRAFLAKHTTAMGIEIADQVRDLEAVARDAEVVPADVASVSTGLDRMSVRMSEPADPATACPPSRTEPYERTPPPPKEHHYRKAWVGSTSVYDAAGNELHTWRYAVEADADPTALADRVAKDVAWIVKAHPGIPVHCVQDAAPELNRLPEALACILPTNTNLVQLVDFEHLIEYLDDIVDACEPEGDPHDMKGWYRDELLRDDGAIDKIWRNLRGLAKRLLGRGTDERKAVAAALSYIRRRKSKMRYASHYAASLPIGSGATESTCWQMQQRVQLPGQSWDKPGLRGVLAMRALVLSDRWRAAWQPYAATHRKEVRAAA